MPDFKKLPTVNATAVALVDHIHPAAGIPTVGLALWLKADAIALSDGTAVATWPDSSGNGNDATQATGGNRPTFETNERNALPVVRFVASSSHYLLANGAASAFSGTDKSLTVFGVVKATLAVSYATWLAAANNATFTQLHQYRVSSDNSGVYQYIKTDDSGATVLQGSANGSANTSWHVHSVLQPGTTVSTWIDGTASIAAAAMNVGATTLDRVTIGGLFYGAALETGVRFDGDIAEILVYGRALSATERAQVEAYLGAKYAITGPWLVPSAVPAFAAAAKWMTD